jgi:mRNA export factor
MESSTSYMFAASGWDGQLRVYDVQPSGVVQKACFKVGEPLLCCSWRGDGGALFVGCADGTTRSVELNSGAQTTLGRQNSPVSSLHWVQEMNVLMANSFDKTMHFMSPGSAALAASFTLEHKVFCSDFKYPIFAAGTSEERVLLMDINALKNKKPITYTECQLGKYSPYQSIAINRDKDSLAVGSIDGRGNISMIQRTGDDLRLNNILTFKCHKVDEGNKQYMYPVNVIDFNPRYKKWCLTMGGDGTSYFWDYEAKNKVVFFQYNKRPATAGQVSPSGELLAYALGYDWHMGAEGHGRWQPRVCVHVIKDQELRYQGAVKR